MLKIRTGAIIIGAITIFMLLLASISGSWWPITAEGLSTLFFVFMICSDKALSRMLYFGAYLALAVILFFVRFAYVVRDPQKKSIV